MTSVASPSVVAALQVALRLEYLQDDFYSRALSAGVIPSADQAAYGRMSQHETAHVARLRSLLTQLGAVPDAKPTFDFTARGAFPDPFVSANYATFKSLAQAFEDLAVRAYKGMLPLLLGSGDPLNTALRIHAVEARHAAEARRLRGERGWITLANTAIPGTAAIYAGEDNLAQGGASNAAAVGDVTSTERASEAFDEPLLTSQVSAIVAPFVA